MKPLSNSELLALTLAIELAFLLYLSLTLLITWRKSQAIRATKHLLDLNSSGDEQLENVKEVANPAFTNRLADLFLHTSYGKWFEAKCLRAGVWQSEAITRWAGRKFEASMTALLVAFAGFQLLSWNIYLLPAFMIAGFFLPDLILIRKGDARSQEIARNLPETIDLLNMTVEAGLGFQAGLERISRMKSNPLSDEFRRVLTEIRLGDSRSRAFTAMAERINQKEIWGFTNAIAQVEKLGIPITSVLRDQAIRMRSERKDKAREIAQKLPVKILAPIMLLLLPSVLIIVLGPAVYSIMQSL